MIINKKILLYSLLAGLAFGASRSWPMPLDLQPILNATGVFSASAHRSAAPGRSLITIGKKINVALSAKI